MQKQQQANFKEIIKRHLMKERRSIILSFASMLILTLTELLSPWPLKIIFDYILLDRQLPNSLAVLTPVLVYEASSHTGRIFYFRASDTRWCTRYAAKFSRIYSNSH